MLAAVDVQPPRRAAKCEAAHASTSAGGAAADGNPVARFEEYVAQAKELFTASFFEKRRGWGHGSAHPVFVVGLHAADRAAIEQRLVCDGVAEPMDAVPQLRPVDLDFYGTVVPRGQPGRLDDALVADLDAVEWLRLAARYLDSAIVGRPGRRVGFVDRRPGNWMHIGLIHLMLPNARIVDVRRAPMAAGFALFTERDDEVVDGFEQADIARYWRAYAELMAHFDEVLPGRVQAVRMQTDAWRPYGQWLTPMKKGFGDWLDGTAPVAAASVVAR